LDGEPQLEKLAAIGENLPGPKQIIVLKKCTYVSNRRGEPLFHVKASAVSFNLNERPNRLGACLLIRHWFGSIGAQ